jgi:GNAT superfamily N-acetyltransferase
MAAAKIIAATTENNGLNWIYERARLEGWGPARTDLKIYSQIDPNGFFISILNNEIIGCISGVRYDESYGYIGYFIVHPDFRGQGYGYQLWNHAMGYLENRLIGLDGVLEQIPRYENAGFQITHYHQRYHGGELTTEIMTTVREFGRGNVSPAHDLVELMNFDSSFFPSPRPSWLHSLITDPTIICLVARDETTNALLGYAAIRPCESDQYRIGPLFATNLEAAVRLLHSLISHIISLSTSDEGSGAAVSYLIDLPDCNEATHSLVQLFQLTEQFSCARMYRYPPSTSALSAAVRVDWNGVFGVSSLEVG